MISIQRVSIIWAVSVLILLIAGCGQTSKKETGKMQVAASIAPLADFSRQVGGKYVDVEMLVPPGANPHTYQITPKQMDILSSAKVLVLNGIGLEYWANKAIDAANNPNLIVVETAKGLPVIDTPEDHDEHDGGNPHVWLDPQYAIKQVQAIQKAFSKADPAHAKYYASNANNYITQLKELDKEIAKQTSTFTSKSFIAFHPSWVYFARRYGLVEAAVIEQKPGREPSPSDIDEIVSTAKKIKAKAIFAEPQFSPKAAEVVAEEAGAKVLVLNPLGNPPDFNYIKTMRDNLSQMSKALK